MFEPDCTTLCDWIKQFNPSYQPSPDHKTMCGSEGCAVFVGNKVVVKFTHNENEAFIASQMIGDPNFPILGVTQYKQYYVIASKELKLGRLDRNLLRNISMAGGYIFNYMKHIETTKELNKITVKDFYQWLKQNKNVNEEHAKLAIQLMKLTQKVYQKSGYKIGTDWHIGNVGLTDKGNVQTFDLGHGRMG